MGASLRARALLIAGAIAVTLGGCATNSSEPVKTEGARTSPDAALESFYQQRPAWGECTSRAPKLQCARLKVPLNYADPGGETIEIEIARDPSTGDAKSPALVVNPGGPGASGIKFLTTAVKMMFGEKLKQNFQIVSFDPRGVGASTPIKCLSDAQKDQFRATQVSGDGPEAIAKLTEQIADFGKRCLEQNEKTLAHVSTVETARDMDIIRASLDNAKLNYLGYSYGTYLGATYAHLFPNQVERMVLDGVLAPGYDITQVARSQAAGFEKSLRHFIDFCVNGGDCALGDTAEAASKNLKSFLAELENQPLPTQDPNRVLTQSLAYEGIFGPLYAESLYPQLKLALNQALRERDGSAILLYADLYSEREADGTYSGNQLDAFMAINSLDYDPVGDQQKWIEQARQLEAEFPLTGEVFSYASVQPQAWPVRPDNGINQRQSVVAKTAEPLLLIGNTGDPATPLQSAKDTVAALGNARLVTWESYTHTAYGWGSKCVKNAVENYLIQGTLPEADLICRD